MTFGYTINFNGAVAPQPYNTEQGSIIELSAPNALVYQFTMPATLQLISMICTSSPSDLHEYQFFINGQSRLNYVFSTQINPVSNTRTDVATFGWVFGVGSVMALRSGQVTGSAAEGTNVQLMFM